MDRLQKQELHVTDGDLRERIKMETFEEIIRQRRLRWAGHVARMVPERLVKQISFGWIPNGTRQTGGKNRMDFAKGVHRALEDRNIPEVDWYRRAQERTTWRQRAMYGVLDEQIPELQRQAKEEGRNWTGVRRKNAFAARKLAGKSDKRTSCPLCTNAALVRGEGQLECPVCAKTFETCLGFSSHYWIY